jgi:hypothetical protein
LKNARDETDTVSKTSNGVWDKGKKKWVKIDKTRAHTTTETFYIKNETIQISTDVTTQPSIKGLAKRLI